MTTTKTHFLPVGIIALACLCMAACSVTTTVQAVVTAAQLAFPAVAIEAKLSAADTALVSGYLTGLQTADAALATIEASTAAPAVKDAEIVQAFGAALAPALPGGTPAAVVAIVDTVAAAVTVFLQAYQPSGVSAPVGVAGAHTVGAPRARPATDRPITVTVSSTDYRHLPPSLKKAVK